MAESVEQELIRKHEITLKSLDEVNGYIERYKKEKEILEKRVYDLQIALSAFKIT